MADAKGSSFWLRHVEKVAVAVLVILCGFWAYWTFSHLSPARLRSLERGVSELSTRVQRGTGAAEFAFPNAQSFMEAWQTPPKLVEIHFDPFQPPIEKVIARVFDIVPAGTIILDAHVADAVGQLSVSAEPQADQVPDQGLMAEVLDDGKVRLTAVPASSPHAKIEYKGRVVVTDANNNRFIYQNIRVTSTPPVAKPPRLASAIADRRKVTLQWDEDPETTAPITGWRIERRISENEEFLPIQSLKRDIPPGTHTTLPRPNPNETRFEDTTVEPSATYSYRVRTEYLVAGSAEFTPPSEHVTVTTRSDLSLALATVTRDMAVLRINKWVKDIEVNDAFPVKPGERIGYNRNRWFREVNQVVDFTTPYFLVDIQPVRQLKQVKRKIRTVDESGRPVEREIETTWWESTFRVVVFNEQKNTHEIISAERTTP